MKRKLPVISVLIISIICLLALSACSVFEGIFGEDWLGGLNFGAGHEHDYQWVDNGDGTHKQHCDVSGCKEPDINEGSHYFELDGYCVCGADINVEGHTHALSLVAHKDANCTETGNNEYYACSGCAEVFSDEEGLVSVSIDEVTIASLGHNFEEYLSDGNATCLKDGTETAKCTRCNDATDTRTADGSALGHDYIPHEGQDASCFKPGWKSYEACSRCDYSSYEELPAIGHHTMADGECAVCGTVDWGYGGLNLTELTKGTYGYEFLGKMAKGESRQSLYTAIDEKVIAMHGDVETDYTRSTGFATVNYSSLGLSSDEAVAVWKTYIDDHPLYYWFSNVVSYSPSALTLKIADEYAEGAVRRECNKIVYDKIQEYLEYAGDETSAYQIAFAFHDKIISAIDYAYDNSGVPESARWAHNIMGVFQEKGAVCESYAKTFQLLLNIRGVNNIFVSGLAGEAHAWNLIQLDDGEWYWCDLTWDDMPDYEWGIAYNHFCVNDWQGIDWADGYNQYGNETGEGIGGSPAGCKTFLTNHTPYSSADAGINFLYDLPARSPHIYAGVDGELLLRDTFKVGGITYALSGYDTVQVTKVESSGAVVISENVEYAKKSYTVISIGVIGGTKLFGAGEVFTRSTTSVTLPSTIKFIWGLVFYYNSLSEITFNGTVKQWSEVEKTTYWKRTDISMTIRCKDGNTTE